MRAWSRLGLPMILGALISGLAGTSEAQLVRYDNFRPGPIDPEKWWGSETNVGAAAPNAEIARVTVLGKLDMLLVSYGRTDSDAGDAGIAANSLRVTNPVPITTLQADVTVKRVSVHGCTANPTATRSRTRVQGVFFNDGTSPGPGDRTGDIGASIQKVRDSLTGDFIEAYVWRCANADCSTIPLLAYQKFVTGWTLGRADTLQVQWDAANNQFRFAVNPASGGETVALAYTVSDALAPILNFKGLWVSNSVASCTSGRKSASTLATFDNVMVNP